MALPITVFTGFFLTVFGVVYLYLTTRNRERMAVISLLEQDKDVTQYIDLKGLHRPSIMPYLILNFALILIGIGMGILIGEGLSAIGMDEDVTYPASVFITAGVALLVGYNLTSTKMKADRDRL